MSTSATAFPPQYPEYPQAPRRKSRWWIPLVIIAAAIIVLIGLFVGFIVFLSKAFSTPEITVKSNSILRLSGLVEEQGETPPFGGLLSDNAASVALYDAMEAIRYAQEDENIQGIYIEGGELNIDNVKRQELRKALEDFKSSGKFIYAFLEYGSKGDFFLASLADSIFMPLEGRLDLTGFGASSLFFKNTFDKLGVTYNVIQFEDFKSAGESFSRTGWSDSAKKSLRPILADAENIFVNTIASSRKVDPTVVKGAMERFISSPDSLLALGLIDRICSRGEVQDLLRRKSRNSSTADEIAEGLTDGFNETGVDAASLADSSSSKKEEKQSSQNTAKEAKGNGEEEKPKQKKLRFISLSRYVASVTPSTESESDEAIAVVYGSGAIISGNGGSPDPFSGDSKMIASEAFIRELRKARDNDKVKAIVLRIDSPGGSVTASDAIWEEIKIARKQKPVYASMSSVAASGGYYMAMACEKIFAHPSTITGSIGVILMFPNFTGLLDKVGVTVDTVQQTPGAFFLDPTLPLNKQHQEHLYVDAEQIYKRFVQRAADSRNMPYEQLRTFAKGRVWLGTDAQANGLVDYLGGLHEAIAYAKEQTGAKDADVITYPKPEDPFEKFIQQYLQNDTDDEVLANSQPSFLAGILQAVGLAPAEAIRQAAPLLATMPQPIIRQLGYAYFLQQTTAKERVLVAMPSLPIFE